MTGVLARAREVDEKYGIFNALAESDSSKGGGRLEGAAVSVKDNICVKGMETRAGSKILDGYRPPFDATVGLKYVAAAGKMWAQLDARFVAEQNRVSQSSGEDATDAFNVVDIRFGYTALRYVDIFGGVENVFDVRYHEHLNRNNIRSPGRNVYVSFAAAL